MHEESPIRSLNRDRAAAAIRSALYDRNGIVGVIGPPDDIRAMTFLQITSSWYSSDLELHDLMTFVRADCRKSTHAKSLIEAAKTWADQADLPLWVGVVSNARTEAKCRLYRRQVAKVGEFFCHLPRHASA